MRSDRMVICCLGAALAFVRCGVAVETVESDLKRIGVRRGIVAVIGLPERGAQHLVDLAKASELTIYFQSSQRDDVQAVQQAADEAGLLGQRLFADHGSSASIQLADNLADCILQLQPDTPDAELLRALRPRASAFVGDRELVKPVPDGIDEWTHPFHGPDNNPQSDDQHVRGAFRTQFLSDPKFSPMPEQSVAAGGRVFKAMGHIAHKANQNEMLNTLLCINAYNGTILWKRALSPGFMIHRNTMIATEDALYMGDHESCKVINAETGEVTREITVPEELTDGPVWKWMAMRDGVLYALVGNPEVQVSTQRSARRGLGHWPWGMWDGHDYKDPRTAFGFGRTLVAIDLNSGEVLWNYRDKEFLDARGVCMNDDSIFCFSAERFLLSVNASDGTPRWKNTDQDLLEAVGPNGQAQHYITGYATTAYMKCNNEYLFFAGPQRSKMVVASAKDGSLAWSHPDGNLQLVLRDDGIYAAGPESSGVRLDYDTGDVLGALPTRRACTRATGCADSIFYRTNGGTVRVMTETYAAHHIAPMRPPCQDGVIISNGHLYWGPWMCGCQLSLYGNICLGTANGPARKPVDSALQKGERIDEVEALPSGDDWPSYRANNARSDITKNEIPAGVKLQWQTKISEHDLPTAPVVAGGLVFIADRTGAVRALDAAGQPVWKFYTAGPVYYPPAVAHDRVYVGSGDGRVYALEAATGRFLWSHRIGPEQRRIPVYSKLISTWPVAGGVVVHDESVFAAAGIAHYDGTYVAKLDARTGELLAGNSDSGALSPEVNSGVSLQGNLAIVGEELQFLAGGVYEVARYDLDNLRCLNTPRAQVTSQFRTAFYPYYPTYGKYLSLDYTCEDGSTICHDASYEGSRFSNLAREAALPAGETRPRKELARWLQRRGEKPPPTLWKDNTNRRFTSFVVSSDKLLATGHVENAPERSFLAAIDVEGGQDVWLEQLPSLAVKGGTAIDRQHRIYVSLENGDLLCFAPQE